jgi:hypothetical protein
MNSIRKAASSFLMLGLIAVVLTIVQPMHPVVDRWFQIGGGVVFGLCLLILILIKPKDESNDKSDSRNEETESK